jgi:hypothetical protein
MGEVELEDVVDARSLVNLLVGCVPHVQQHGLAGLDLEGRLDRVVPRVPVCVTAEVVERMSLGGHRRSPGSCG